MLLRLKDTNDLCVLCLLKTVVHGGIVCAVRQSALSSLQCLIDDPKQLSLLGPATISRIHSRLLSSLLSVSPPPPAPFASQLIPFICSLSMIADTQLHPPPSTTATSFIAATVNASVSTIQSRSCSVAVPLLAAIISSVSSPRLSSRSSLCTPSPIISPNSSNASLHRYLCAALGRNALAFIRKVLKKPPDVTTWPTTASVLNATIKTSPLTLSADKIISLVPIPPTLQAHTASTSAYLSVIATTVEVHSNSAPKFLLDVLDDFVSVARHALLSSNSELSALAANIITTLVRLSPPVACALVQNNVTEYLIETLRTAYHPTTSSSDCSPSGLSTLAALASQCPDVLTSKWPYALSVVMACTSVVELNLVPQLLTILRTAFEKAAVSAFSPTIVQQMVALIFRLLNQDCPASSIEVRDDDRSHVNSAIECLLLLLSRYRLTNDLVHTVLSVSEICSANVNLLTSGICLLQTCASQFCDLVEKQEDRNVFHDEEGKRLRKQHESALVSLGKRLVFILLDTYGPLLYSKVDTPESAISFLGGDGIVSLMHTFTIMMHSTFVDIGCISPTDHTDMRLAFWNILPVSITYAAFKERPDSDKDLRDYIGGLLFDMEHGGDSCLALSKSPSIKGTGSYPHSAENFVKKLSQDVRPLEMAVAFKMLQTGLAFGNVQALGESEVIVDALFKRVENILHISDDITVNLSSQWQDHLVETMISISSLCHTNNMVFPAGRLSEDAGRVFVSRCKDMSKGEPFNIACEILCSKHLEAIHFIIWENIANFLSYSYTVQVDERKTSLYVMCETNEVVLNGIVNAVFRVPMPQKIAALVSCLYLHSEDRVSHLKASSKRDVIQTTVQQLAHVRTAWKKGNISTMLNNVSSNSDFFMDCLRVSALLEIIVSTDAVSDTAASWSLLRILAELFTLIGTLLSTNQPLTTLHASMLHCVMQMVKNSQDSKRLMYMAETGGLLKHCISVLKAVPESDIGIWELQRNEYVLSYIGLFLVAMMQNKNVSVQNVSENLVLSELTSDSEVWECALADHLERHEVATAQRISNLTILLHKTSILAKSSHIPQFVSSYVLTLVCVSCASPRIFVSDVSHLLLSGIIESDEKLVNLIPQDVLYILSEIMVYNVCSLGGQLVSANELNCSRQFVLSGKVDRHLVKLHDSLYITWKEWNTSSAKLNSTTVKFEERIFSWSSLARLLLAVKERISCVCLGQNPHTKVKNVSQRDLKKIELDANSTDTETCTMLLDSQLYHANNPHVLRIRAS